MISLGATYTLDGSLLKCIKLTDDFCKFQEVNEDGTPAIVYHKNSKGEETTRIADWGIRIVGDRIVEMKRV